MTVDDVGRFLWFLCVLDFFLFVFVTLSILVMHFAMPSAILDRYFRPPHFRDWELVMFTGIPYAPMRTIMLMRAIAYPSSGKVRGVTEADTLVPAWYRVASKILVISIILGNVIAAICVVGGGIVLLIDR